MTYADRNQEHSRTGSDKQIKCDGLGRLIGA